MRPTGRSDRRMDAGAGRRRNTRHSPGFRVPGLPGSCPEESGLRATGCTRANRRQPDGELFHHSQHQPLRDADLPPECQIFQYWNRINEAYYEFLREGSEIVDGIPVLKAEHIIPFKARAWIDLSSRKENGESIDSRNIKKHKNDIFRLSMLLSPEQKIKTSDEIKEDLLLFIQSIRSEDIDLKQLGIRGTNKNYILDLLCRIYDLPPLQEE